MKVKEVYDIVENWYNSKFDDTKKFKGAFISGSLSELDPEADFPQYSSDADIRVVVDPEYEEIKPQRYPDGKYYYQNGIFIQCNYLLEETIEQREKYMGNIAVATNLRDMRIISDPTGKIRSAGEDIVELFDQPQWTKKRVDIAETHIRKLLERYHNSGDGFSRQQALIRLIMFVSGIIPIACNITPTHRKCLVLSDTVLSDLDHEELQQELIDLLGIEKITSDQINDACNILDEFTRMIFQHVFRPAGRSVLDGADIDTSEDFLSRFFTTSVQDAASYRLPGYAITQLTNITSLLSAFPRMVDNEMLTQKYNELVEIVLLSHSQAVKEVYRPVDSIVERFIEVAQGLVKT